MLQDSRATVMEDIKHHTQHVALTLARELIRAVLRQSSGGLRITQTNWLIMFVDIASQFHPATVPQTQPDSPALGPLRRNSLTSASQRHPQPLIPLPPPLHLTPSSLLLRRHPPGDIAPRQWQQRLSQPLTEHDPEGGPLRHEQRPWAKANRPDHHRR